MKLEKNYSAKKLLYKFKIDLWGTFVLQRKFNFRITKRLLMEFETLIRMHFFKNLRKNKMRFSKIQKFYNTHQRQLEKHTFLKKSNKINRFKHYNNKFRVNKFRANKFKKNKFKRNRFSKFYRFRIQKKFIVPRPVKPNDPEYKFSRFFWLDRKERILRKKFRFLKMYHISKIRVNFRYLVLRLKFSFNKIKILKKFFFNQQKIVSRNYFLKFKYHLYYNYLQKKSFFLKKTSLKKLFFLNLFNYSTYCNNKLSITPKLESIWIKTHLIRLKFVLPKLLGKLYYKYSLKRIIKRPFKRLSTMDYHNKVELLKHLNFFCFSTLSQIRRFLKRTEFMRRPNNIYLGIEGCFLNLLFRTNLFLTTKQAYTLIKLGAFSINNKVIINPYKILSIFDFFSVNKPFIKLIWSTFLNRIRKNLILVNIPNYLDYNYKLLNFFIWRLPTEQEARFVYSFPFFRPFVDSTKIYPFKYKNISLFDYAPPKKFKR